MERAHYYTGINALRGLAATLVVVQHAGAQTSSALHVPLEAMIKVAFGSIGVQMFFVISGFVIGLNRHLPTSEFIARRALRIYPGYWAALAIAAVLMALAGVPDDFRWYVPFLLPSTTYPSYAIPVWTLIFEVAFYAASAALFSLRLSDEKLTGVILCWMLAIIAMSPYIAGDRMAMPGALILLAQNCLFFAGGLLCAVHVGSLKAIPRNAFLALAVAGSAVLPLLPPVNLAAMCLLVVVMAALVMASTRLDIAWRPAQVLGNSSYGLFLLHNSVQGLGAFYLRDRLEMWGLFATLAIIGLIIGIAFGAIEFSIHRALLKRFLLRSATSHIDHGGRRGGLPAVDTSP